MIPGIAIKYKNLSLLIPAHTLLLFDGVTADNCEDTLTAMEWSLRSYVCCSSYFRGDAHFRQ